MDIRDLAVSVDGEHEASGRWGLSVACLPNRTGDEIVARQFRRKPLTNRKIRTSTVAAIKAAGFDVIADGRPPHALILFQAEPTTEDWGTLIEAFGQPEPNPGLVADPEGE